MIKVPPPMSRGVIVGAEVRAAANFANLISLLIYPVLDAVLVCILQTQDPNVGQKLAM